MYCQLAVSVTTHEEGGIHSTHHLSYRLNVWSACLRSGNLCLLSPCTTQESSWATSQNGKWVWRHPLKLCRCNGDWRIPQGWEGYDSETEKAEWYIHMYIWMQFIFLANNLLSQVRSLLLGLWWGLWPLYCYIGNVSSLWVLVWVCFFFNLMISSPTEVLCASKVNVLWEPNPAFWGGGISGIFSVNFEWPGVWDWHLDAKVVHLMCFYGSEM